MVIVLVCRRDEFLLWWVFSEMISTARVSVLVTMLWFEERTLILTVNHRVRTKRRKPAQIPCRALAKLEGRRCSLQLGKASLDPKWGMTWTEKQPIITLYWDFFFFFLQQFTSKGIEKFVFQLWFVPASNLKYLGLEIALCWCCLALQQSGGMAMLCPVVGCIESCWCWFMSLW